ncbi:MAG: glutamate formimidoyltransferase [Clostridiales bacterium]|jgi:glutamate formiminotransferase|nr:glutamate formimidoyltransferase [Clostridiales bacterium]
MPKLIECVPNFSEGRNRDIIDALIKEAGSVAGVLLLDTSSDPSHNRSVFTLAGEPEAVGEAAFRLCKAASEKIDLTMHSGEHPRMGATDVIPFIPVKDTNIAECVALSKQVAERVWNELGIPVFLYEESAAAEYRRNLAQVRKGEFEGMPEKLLLPEWAPDFGERKVHPTAGVTAVGARKFLVAFNINLGTSDIKIAKAIAKAVRGSSGGYKCCKAIGVILEDRNIAQVSINMVDYDTTPLYRVFEAVRFEAERWGAPIIGSEIIGLTPMKALINAAEYYLKIQRFDFKRQVFENHLLNL